MRYARRVSIVAIALLSTFCTVPVRKRSFSTNPTSLDHGARYLKAHLRNGDVVVLSQWSIDSGEKNISGTGDHYDADRKVVEHGAVTVPIDSVALFETNVVSKSKRVAALSVMTGVTAAVTVLCATSPKTCFGSCPTFYTEDAGRWSLQAEGFSASIAPSLEDTDLDSLYRAHPTSSRFNLRMRNEALETHVVRSVRLLAAPRDFGARVFATEDREFWSSSHIAAPSRCRAAEGDCRAALGEFDGVERFSTADPRNLGRHEVIEIQFDRRDQHAPAGIVIAARQTLLSTFLLYQALAYLGSNATAALASRESGGTAVEERAGGITQLLGGIDVLIDDGGRWRKVATFHETGPLATDVHLLPLPPGAAKDGRIRLSMTRGLWRLDYVAFASLDRRVEPVPLSPVEIRHGDGTLETSSGATLVTLPGEGYEFAFDLPGRPEDHELFLESRGYYLEWMRNEWMREESRLRAAMMFYAPRLALRVLAPQFKTLEPQIESQFWNSRYAIH